MSNPEYRRGGSFARFPYLLLLAGAFASCTAQRSTPFLLTVPILPGCHHAGLSLGGGGHYMSLSPVLGAEKEIVPLQP